MHQKCISNLIKERNAANPDLHSDLLIADNQSRCLAVENNIAAFYKRSNDPYDAHTKLVKKTASLKLPVHPISGEQLVAVGGIWQGVGFNDNPRLYDLKPHLSFALAEEEVPGTADRLADITTIQLVWQFAIAEEGQSTLHSGRPEAPENVDDVFEEMKRAKAARRVARSAAGMRGARGTPGTP